MFIPIKRLQLEKYKRFCLQVVQSERVNYLSMQSEIKSYPIVLHLHSVANILRTFHAPSISFPSLNIVDICNYFLLIQRFKQMALNSITHTELSEKWKPVGHISCIIFSFESCAWSASMLSFFLFRSLFFNFLLIRNKQKNQKL